jgi:hypothetical protein
MRLSVAPGFLIPFSGVDFGNQTRNVMTGGDVTASNIDRHVFGFGGRVNYDYVFNPSFYLGLCSEVTFFPVKSSTGKTNMQEYPITPRQSVDYGWELMFEVEPHYDYPVADGFVLGAGLPMTITTSPAVKYDGREGAVGNHYLFTMMPLVSMMFTRVPVPVQVELDYMIPVFGKNEQAAHALTLLVKIFYALPGAKGLTG